MKTGRKLIAAALLRAASVIQAVVADNVSWRRALERCEVVWQQPSKDSLGAMPLGSADIGFNVWLEPGGNLRFCAQTVPWEVAGNCTSIVAIDRVELDEQISKMFKATGAVSDAANSPASLTWANTPSQHISSSCRS